jgi:hypothetical protein
MKEEITSKDKWLNSESNNSNFKMIQWSPSPRVLPYDHPCVNNTQPAYIEKYDRFIKIGNNTSRQKSLIPQNEILFFENPIQQQPFENTDNTIENPISFQNTTVKSTVSNKTEILEIEIQPKEGPKVRFTGDELLNLDTTSYIDIVEDLIPSEEITVLAGKGGIGKSLLYEQLCLLICLKVEDFIGKKVEPKYNSTLIIATEDNEKRLSNRIKKQIKKIAPGTTSIPGLLVITTGEDLIKTIRTEFENKQYDLVVIDALGDLLRDDSYSATVVRQFYNEFEKIIREFGTTFLIVHHEGKSGSKDGRTRILGSVAIVDRARSVIMLSKDNRTCLRTLTIEKSNNISDEKIGKPIYLGFDSDSMTFFDIPEPKLAIDKKMADRKSDNSYSGDCIVKRKPGRQRDMNLYNKAIQLFKDGHPQVEIARIIGRDKSIICKWINEFKSNQKPQ